MLQVSEPRETAFIYDMADKAVGRACLRDGWHISADDEVWSGAPECRLHIALPGNDAFCCVQIGLAPLIVPHLVPKQTLSVRSGDVVLGEYRVLDETALLIHIPLELTLHKRELELSFIVPDAMSMAGFASYDTVYLGIMLDWIKVEAIPKTLQSLLARRNDADSRSPVLARATQFNLMERDELETKIRQEFDLSAAQLMSDYESLGDNCAFGLAQREASCEVIGLLRFANTPIRSLLRGLADDFAAVSVGDNLVLWLHPNEPREYYIRLESYRIRWHTMVHEGELDAATVLREHSTKLAFAKRKFIDGLKNGHKTYVLTRTNQITISNAAPPYGAPPLPPENTPLQLIPGWDTPQAFEERAHPLSLYEVLPVLMGINRYRNASLLYIVHSTDHNPSGTVEMIAPNLMRGYIKSFVIDHPNDNDCLRLAANAKWLQREMLAGAAG